MIEENRFESASFNGHSMRVLMQYEDGINKAGAAGTAGRCWRSDAGAGERRDIRAHRIGAYARPRSGLDGRDPASGSV